MSLIFKTHVLQGINTHTSVLFFNCLMLLVNSLLAVFLENTIRRDLVGGMSQIEASDHDYSTFGCGGACMGELPPHQLGGNVGAG